MRGLAAGLGAALVAAAVVGTIVTHPTTPPSGAELDRLRTGAARYCQDFLTEKLIAPTGWSTPTVAGSGPFRVVGTVDSQDGYGTALRNEYACRGITVDGYTWTLESWMVADRFVD